jgi:2-desacetyl-2-hydroxyethyl bacteriochlorophyllide A dehydrogenase
MKALVYTGPGELSLQELPRPDPGAHEVLIRVTACGICGSDLHGYLGKSRIRIPPAVMGHEFSGTVASVGEAVADPSIGRHVVVQPLIGCGTCRCCRAGRPNICPRRRLIGAHLPGGFAEYVVVPEGAVYPIPDSLSDLDAALVEPLGNAVHMLSLGTATVYQDIVVLGAGTLGLLTARLARQAGARHVIVTDTQPHRLDIAHRLGADLTLNARAPHTPRRILEATEGGATLVIDAVGITATRRQAIEVAAPGATVILLGNAEPESPLPLIDVVNRELIVRGSYSCTDEEFRRAIALIADGGIDTGSWVTEVTLDQGQEIFQRLVRDPGDLIKVVFRF